MRPILKPPGTKHLKLNCEKMLSTFAFKFSLCRYKKEGAAESGGGGGRRVRGRGLHSFQFPLNLSILPPFPLNLKLLCPSQNPN
jgi:hypothetical protein